MFGQRVLGPQSPPVDRINGVYILGFLLKIENTISFSKARRLLAEQIDAIRNNKEWNSIYIYCDVDPQ